MRNGKKGETELKRHETDRKQNAKWQTQIQPHPESIHCECTKQYDQEAGTVGVNQERARPN